MLDSDTSVSLFFSSGRPYCVVEKIFDAPKRELSSLLFACFCGYACWHLGCTSNVLDSFPFGFGAAQYEKHVSERAEQGLVPKPLSADQVRICKAACRVRCELRLSRPVDDVFCFAALFGEQVADLVELLKNPIAGEEEFLVELLTNRVPPG